MATSPLAARPVPDVETEEIVAVDHLDFFYGDRQVLFDVSLTVRRGEIVVIMGGSGSGKTTLLRHLMGLMPAQPGKIRLFGKDIARLSEGEMQELRRKMGVAFQSGALFSSMNVTDNITLPLRELVQLDEETMAIMARLKLETVNLSGFGDLMPSELSGGMVKRASIARAIVMDPQLLFLDEPTSGLDPAVSAQIDDLVLKLRAAMNMSVVIITHDPKSAFTVADRILILDQGRIVIDGPPDLVRASRDERVRNLLQRRFEETDIDPAQYLRRIMGKDEDAHP
ncbi:MAG TPA: ATP-binding cassette domain-containing protein [Dongiaceae bacterium]|jgi:phospholipid/cholesterol/gamma-HCH transport system ATP-binding protein|nr:ATP-binding cassette domain-containing protein [Dongiaceae bacterium]